jgi:hypothetical protein
LTEDKIPNKNVEIDAPDCESGKLLTTMLTVWELALFPSILVPLSVIIIPTLHFSHAAAAMYTISFIPAFALPMVIAQSKSELLKNISAKNYSAAKVFAVAPFFCLAVVAAFYVACLLP